ncbi:MAG: hypothetical protein Q9200_007598 [Gallowayella weberi]
MAFHESSSGLQAYNEGLSEVSPYERLERHVPPSDEKEYYSPQDQLPPEIFHVNHPTSPGPNAYRSHAPWHATQSEQNQPPTQEKRALWKRKGFWIPLAILVLIGAIVGGIAGGLTIRKYSFSVSDKEDSKTSPNSTAASPSKSISTASPSSTSSPAQPSSKPLNSSLALVAWSDHGNLKHRRLYYQDDTGTIKESAWNSSADMWYLSQDNLAKAKPNTPIAAAVAGNVTWPLQSSLYYLNLNGYLVERFSSDALSWKIGQLTSEEIIPSPNSDLAAIWSQTDHQNRTSNNSGVQNALLAYQDSNDRIWVVNATGSTPILTRLEAYPTPGTGIAFQSVWHSMAEPGLRLYYMKGAADLIIVDYEVSEYGAKLTGDGAWNWNASENNPVGSVSPGASIASFTSGDDPSGDPLFYYTLSSGPQGDDDDD